MEIPKPRIKRKFWQKKRWQLLAAFLLVLVIANLWASRLERLPILAETVLPDGKRICVHAVLQKDSSDFTYRVGDGFLNKFTQRILPPETGMIFVLSCRDSKTGQSLGWKWFGTLETKDQFGNSVRLDPEHWFLYQGGRSRGGAGRKVLTQDFDQSSSNGQSSLQLLTVAMATPDVPRLQNLDLFDLQRQKVGQLSLDVKIPEPAKGFVPERVSFGASAYDLEGTMSRVKVRRMNFDKEVNRFSEPKYSTTPVMDFRFRGRFISSDELVTGVEYFEDRVGNRVGTGWHPLLPKGVGVWKYVTHLARSNMAEFDDHELRPLGRFQLKKETQLCEIGGRSSGAMAFFPPGKRISELDHTAFHVPEEVGRQSDRYLMGQVVRAPKIHTYSSSAGGGGSGHSWHYDASFSTTVEAFSDGRGGDEIYIEMAINSESPYPVMTTISEWPLVILPVKQGTTDVVHCLIAADETGTRVPVHPCYHSIRDQPVYAIEIEETAQVSLYYHRESLRRLEFTIPAMLPEGSAIDLVPDGKAWRTFPASGN